jgi:tetratricopeptide (TPR) repeat protein
VFAARQPGFESLPIRHLFTLPPLARLEMMQRMRPLFTLFLLAVLSLARAQEAARPETGTLEVVKREARNGKLTEALAALDKVDKARKPTAESLDLRGCIYLEQEKFDDATKAFEAAHAADDASFLPRLHLGDVIFRQKKFEDARAVYERLDRQTNILISAERLRYGILLARLGAHDEAGAQLAFARIKFPTETPTYYYAQAAWQFAHGRNGDAKKWLSTADQIFDAASTAWFARPLYDLGWVKKKPIIALD